MCLVLHFYPTKQMKVTLPCFSLLLVMMNAAGLYSTSCNMLSAVAVYSKLELVLTEEALGLSLPLIPQQNTNPPLG